jgi:hypothetical protein
MKTKTLLIAAAALVAGVISSRAQVYSVNVVGYANQYSGATSYLLANPLDSGNNTLTNLFPSVPGASTISVWNGSGYTQYKFTAGHWKVGTTVSDSVLLPPGQGFFFTPSVAYTNTWVGSVVANAGNNWTVTNSLTTSQQLVGSLIPYADSITNTQTVNLLVAGASTISKWNVGSQTYTLYKFTAGQWKIGSTVSVPSLGVGEGFFITPTASTNWVEVLH